MYQNNSRGIGTGSYSMQQKNYLCCCCCCFVNDLKFNLWKLFWTRTTSTATTTTNLPMVLSVDIEQLPHQLLQSNATTTTSFFSLSSLFVYPATANVPLPSTCRPGVLLQLPLPPPLMLLDGGFYYPLPTTYYPPLPSGTTTTTTTEWVKPASRLSRRAYA